jgi:hypothetical protein
LTALHIAFRDLQVQARFFLIYSRVPEAEPPAAHTPVPVRNPYCPSVLDAVLAVGSGNPLLSDPNPPEGQTALTTTSSVYGPRIWPDEMAEPGGMTLWMQRHYCSPLQDLVRPEVVAVVRRRGIPTCYR